MTTAHDPLQQGIEALKAGRKAEARKLLAQVVQQDQHNETAWLWLSGAVDKDSERRFCLERVLAINPSNGIAKRGLATIQRRMGEVSPFTRVQTPAVEPKPASPTPGPVAPQAPRLQPASPLPTEAGRRLLEREIERFTKQGWQLVSQSETSAQLRKPKQWSRAGVFLFVVLPLIGGILFPALFGVALFGLLFVLADYMLKKEQLKYITVEQLEQRRREQARREEQALNKGAMTKGVVALVVLVGAALVVGLAIVWALTLIPRTSPGAPLPTEIPTKVPMLSTGKWETHYDTSAFDDSRTVVIRLDAESEIEGWLDTYTPYLVIRCQEGETDAYVVTGMQADVEYGMMGEVTTRVRFDKGYAQEVVMGESTDGEALFFPNPIPWIGRMMEHNQMVFGFTPFNASPVETTFDLRGLDETIKPLRETCRW